ncbi:MAG: hypothetical protein ABS911_04115 [Carnobacterium sp.]
MVWMLQNKISSGMDGFACGVLEHGAAGKSVVLTAFKLQRNRNR